MSGKLLYDDQLDTTPLTGKTIAVIGYGSQGRAQALCLRDAGVIVLIGARPGSGWDNAVADGWSPLPVAEAVKRSEIVALLVRESGQKELFETAIVPNLPTWSALVFAHGFNLLYDQILPPEGHDVVLVAPMGAGPSMRALYEAGGGVSGLVAVHRDASGAARELGLAYAKALGCGRAGVIESTVREEVETDLFGEQAVLCGGLTSLAKAGFDTLVEAGYSEELAYFECVHQIKLLADLIHSYGIAGMRKRISDTALFGDLTRGPRVVGEASREAMRQVLAEIKHGQFAKDWIGEQATDLPTLRSFEDSSATVDAVGNRLRAKS